MAKASKGDHGAFNELVSRHQAGVVQFVRSRLNPRIDAEDVAQEIFVAAWRQLPRFHQRARFRTWLFGIARNWCAEAVRRHGRNTEPLGELDERQEAALAPAWGERPSRPGEALVERESIRSWLARLPDVEREVVELYYFGDLNLREIGELTQTNLSTVKTRFYQAHRKLRSTAEAEELLARAV